MKAARRCRLRAVKREPGENPGRYSHCDGERFPRATGKLGRRKRAEPSQETCLGVESPICCLQIDLPACVFFGMRVPGRIFVARKSGCRRCSRFYISSDGVPGAFPEHKIFERRLNNEKADCSAADGLHGSVHDCLRRQHGCSHHRCHRRCHRGRYGSRRDYPVSGRDRQGRCRCGCPADRCHLCSDPQ